MAPTRQSVASNPRRNPLTPGGGELGVGPLRSWPASLDKSYVDVLLPDGSVLILYLAHFRLLGIPVGRFWAELHRADGKKIRAAGPLGSCETRRHVLGAAPEPRPLSVRWEAAGLCGELTYRPRHEAVTLREPLLQEGVRRLEWTVDIPDADVGGELRWPGGEARIEGRGYQDRVRLDLLPWRLPLRELHWGRAAAGAHACTWLEAVTTGGTVGLGWIDGKPVRPEAARPVLEDARSIADVAVADTPGLHLGGLRPIVRRLFRNPRQERWAARANIGGDEGRAVFERVSWR